MFNLFSDQSFCNTDSNENFLVLNPPKPRIIKDKPSVIDINLSNYSYDFCQTESSVGGTCLYSRNYDSYKLRKDLRIYK